MDISELIHYCGNGLNDPDSSLQERIHLVNQLGQTDDRRVYPLLLETLKHKDLAEYTVLTLAGTGDSRALFPLLNLFQQTTNPVIQQRVLQYLYNTGDPRAEEFLQAYVTDPNKPYQDIAHNALAECKDNFDFHYRYNGSDEGCKRAQSAKGRILVLADELARHEQQLQENQAGFDFERPQTYIVDMEGLLYIGGTLNEHVQVAQGQDVLAAGELKFERTGILWSVVYVNNRSNSYYPAASSFAWVKEFLEQSDVGCDKESFDEIFPPAGFNDPEFLSLFPLGKDDI
ncbi:HEAT repeat domain-containing protein [Candidatus Woesearchaeota archaeon]|nr:HEAT repeat domain-containing protein [Candidatus Woesearchaeota archaeon]